MNEVDNPNTYLALPAKLTIIYESACVSVSVSCYSGRIVGRSASRNDSGNQLLKRFALLPSSLQ